MLEGEFVREPGSVDCFSKPALPEASFTFIIITHSINLKQRTGCGSGHRERIARPSVLSDAYRIASVAGTAEPVYGPEAFQSVIARSKDNIPVCDLSPEDYEWTLPEQSHVETATFYITAESGHSVMCQIIHSKVK